MIRFSILALLILLIGCAPNDPAPDFLATAYVGSTVCQDCHEDRHASWARTFHRTMTQVAGASSVQGAFDGRTVQLNGGAVRPLIDQGRYWFEYVDVATGAVLGRIEVERTVGSNRYQQYLGRARDGGENYYRLEMLWHNQEQRWVPMSGAFFSPDGERMDAHFTTWDQNCIFCHNTGPQPRVQNMAELRARAAQGERLNFPDEARYRSSVAELGIACESCHGPGAAHAAANDGWLRRTQLKLSGAADPTIINPARLDAARSADVCGACHAQRQPKTLEMVNDWLTTGPTFRPGDALTDHVTPVTMATPGTADDPALYSLRFWRDGSPRLSAYEYQSFNQSKCQLGERELSCINCHSMHDGDPRGMQTERQRSDAVCAECHAPIAADAAQHSGHAAGSEGAKCYSCHMPKMVYGVMEIHRSHRIEKPDPAANAANDRPDACSACHLDWSTAQIVAKMAQQPDPGAGVPRHLEMLLGGDPIERAVAANQARTVAGNLSPDKIRAEMAALNVSLSDPYPAVRRFAWRSMVALNTALPTPLIAPPELAAFDWMAAAQPSPFALDAPPLPAATLADLKQRAAAQARQISIGE
jgi:Doubled CXXCH motif (Paired_CXXCH_1)